MRTSRVPSCEVMPSEEKEGFCHVVGRFDWLYQPTLRALRPYANSSYSLLDVGCGEGTLLRKIKIMFPHLVCVGIDIDPFFIERARKKNPCDCDIDCVEEMRRTADIVISNLSFHHFKQPSLALDKLTSSARKVVIISDQLRPATEKALLLRLQRRTAYLHDKFGVEYCPPFYNGEQERASILESYSKEEILVFAKHIQSKIMFYDNDYYERFVWIIKKN